MLEKPREQRSRNRNPFVLQSQIRMAGKSAADLARAAGVHQSTVQTAIFRLQPAGCRIIASFLGEAVHEIWPEWFDRFGNVIRCADGDVNAPDPRERRQKETVA